MKKTNFTTSIEETVYDFIIEKDLIVKGDRLLLSCSAGKDSMAMLHILLSLQNRLSFSLNVFHLNHCIRDKESEGDRDFLKNLCESLDLKFHLEEYDFKKNIPSGVSFEEYARTIRYDMLNTIAHEKNINKIVTGHTKSDSIETVLMRIFSGTGIQGLTGIPTRRDNIIRPIICLTTKDVVKYCTDSMISWREDSSNAQNLYLRNRIRNSILPYIHDTFPQVYKAVENLEANALEHRELLEELILERYPDIIENENEMIIVNYDPIKENTALMKFFIARAVSTINGGFLSVKIFDEILRKLQSRKSNIPIYSTSIFNIYKTVLNSRSVLCIEKGTEKKNDSEKPWEYSVTVKSNTTQTLTIPELDCTLVFSFIDYDKWLSNRNILCISMPEESVALVIRNRRHGDRLITDSGTKKLKDYFIEKKLDSYLKNSIPILSIDNAIAAVMGHFLSNELPFRVSKKCYVSDNSKKILAVYKEGTDFQ